jgi:hypothetical protein
LAASTLCQAGDKKSPNLTADGPNLGERHSAVARSSVADALLVGTLPSQRPEPRPTTRPALRQWRPRRGRIPEQGGGCRLLRLRIALAGARAVPNGHFSRRSAGCNHKLEQSEPEEMTKIYDQPKKYTNYLQSHRLKLPFFMPLFYHKVLEETQKMKPTHVVNHGRFVSKN